MRIDDNWSAESLEIIKDINANVLITSLNRRYPYDELKEFDLIASCTTGVDHLDIRDLPLICLRGETEFLQNIRATSEMTWALIMSLIRKMPWAFESVKRGKWDRESFQGAELFGKTLGIVGYGRVGRQVKRIGEAFGMCLTLRDPQTDLYGRTLDSVLCDSDILTVHVPLNANTNRMFGEYEFKHMKKTAYFINTSRSQIVDGYALCRAIENKEIAGAAIDVAEDYSPNLKRSLIKTGKCIITPHLGGNTAESRRSTQIFLANRIKEYINGL